MTAARISLGALACSLLGIFFALNVRSHARLNQLRNEGVAVLGRVEATHCQNHGELAYSFWANNQQFTNKDTCSINCTEAMVGDPVNVIYAESNPRNSECKSLSSKKEDVVGGYLSLLLIGVVAFVLTLKATAPARAERD